MADWRRSQIPPDLGHGLVSGLDHNSAHACASTALASPTDTSVRSDKKPVLAQHAGQGAFSSTENILPESGFSFGTQRMFS